jgi:transcriptional regulator with XRE-family HTH domain
VLSGEPDFNERELDRHSVGANAIVGARIASARRELGLTQRALADLLGVRLWNVELWESGARPLSAAHLSNLAEALARTPYWIETGNADSAPALAKPIREEVHWWRSEATGEESRKELDEHLLEAAGGEVEVRERGLQRTLTRVDGERAVIKLGREEPSATERERRELGRLLIEIAEREAALASRESQLQGALREVNRRRAVLETDLAKFAESRRLEEARLAARERGLGPEGAASSLEARERWLIEAVKAAAKREAETVVALANDRAKLVIARAEIEQETARSVAPVEPVEE